MTQPTAPAREPGVVARECPFVGLTPFTEADWPFFFGREADQRILISNLSAARLTLVYGPSGVGKSSLLRAGVIRDLRQAAKEALDRGRLPDAIAVIFASWRDDPLGGLAEAIELTVSEWLGELAPEPVPREGLLDELLLAWNTRLDVRARRLEHEADVRQPEHVDLLLILDQFEEYFLYHADEVGEGTFAGEFPRAVNRRGLRANVLVSLREDAYAQLDRFGDEIPNLFGNSIKIGHLGRAAAEAAIRGPVERYTELGGGDGVPHDVAADLVDAVIEQVRTGTLVLGQTGGGVVESGVAETDVLVETPFLQLVMERLWTAEREAGSPVMRLETLEKLEGAERIVRNHLEQAIGGLSEHDQNVAASVFGRLVTPSGTKIAYLPSDLAALENVSRDALLPVLEELARLRILRSAAAAPGETEPHYEIYHDVLAPAVLDWRARWLQAQEHAATQQRMLADLRHQQEERQKAEAQAAREQRTAERFRLLFAVTGLLGLVAVAVAVWAVIQRHETRVARKTAEVSELRREMNVALVSHPAQAITLAERAMQAEKNSRKSGWATAGLRDALRQPSPLAVLHPGAGAIRAADFSADGRRVITVAGGKVDLWSATDGRHLVRLTAGTPLLDAALSSNGRLVAGAGANGHLLLWHVPGGRPNVLPRSGRSAILLTSFDRAGERVLAGSADGVRIWDLRRRRLLRLLRTDQPAAAAFSPDGTLVLTASDQLACVWNARTGAILHVLARVGGKTKADKTKAVKTKAAIRKSTVCSFPETEDAPVLPSSSRLRAAAFSPDGRLVVTGDDAGDVQVWDAVTGHSRTVRKMSGAVTSIAFERPQGQRRAGIVTGAADGTVQVWRAGAVVKPTVAPRGHTDQVAAVAFSPDGRWIVTASADQTAAVWNAATGAREAVLLGHGDTVERAAFSGDGSRILTASDDGTARLWRLPVQPPDVVLHSSGSIYDAMLSGDGRRVLVVPGDFDRPAMLYDTRSGRRLKGLDRVAPFAALSADGRRVITIDPRHVASWNATTGAKIASVRMRVLVRPVTSADRRWIIVVTPKGILLWDTRRAKPPRQSSLRAAGHGFDTVAISGDGSRLAVNSRGDRVEIWNTKTRRRLARIDVASGGIFGLSPDGTLLVGAARVKATAQDLSVTGSGTATTAWDTATGNVRFVLGSRDSARIIRFAPEGDLLLTAGDGNVARLWSARNGALVRTLRGHTGPIEDASFSGDGRFVVTASQDGTARIWLSGSGQLLAELRQGRAGRALHASFDASGRRVLVLGSDDSAAIYSCRLCGGAQDLLTLAGNRKTLDFQPQQTARRAGYSSAG